MERNGTIGSATRLCAREAATANTGSAQGQKKVSSYPTGPLCDRCNKQHSYEYGEQFACGLMVEAEEAGIRVWNCAHFSPDILARTARDTPSNEGRIRGAI